MVQMQAQSGHRQDIEQRHVPDREAGHHVLVHREVLELTGPVADEPSRQMEQMVDDEEGQDHAAPAHGCEA